MVELSVCFLEVVVCVGFLDTVWGATTTPLPITKCDMIVGSKCSCVSDLGIVDLSPISNTDGTARWDNIQGLVGSDTSYLWNPCAPFTGSGCTSVAGCQRIGTSIPPMGYGIGTIDLATFKVEGSWLNITYQGGEGGRNMNVALVCSSADDTVVYIGEGPTLEYNFQYTGKYACPDSGGGGGGGALSPGTILTIIFFCLVFVYIIGGFAFQGGVRKARGRELVPNYEFWTACPGYIRDGVMCTVRCGKLDRTYSNI